ncbi:MAG TPA: hypothetical protein PLF01_06565, partial [Alphaproteobacteria bacterium]|nr:hypothetical protein [Alphaproteobacteria bacterium]
TIEDVFKNEDLAHGRMILNGKLIEPALITKTALMTVEGTKDDISAPGQCIAAHRLCASLPEDMKFAHLEEGAGHYGIFNGRKFENNIALRLIGFMRDMAAKNGIKYDKTPSMEPTPWHIARARDYNFPVAERNDLGLKLVS